MTPALTALPALVAVVAGEVLRLRSWMYYVLAGGAALAVVPLLAAPQGADLTAIAASPYMTIFAAAGFAGGFIYWLLAGSAGLSLEYRARRSAPARQAGRQATARARAA